MVTHYRDIDWHLLLANYMVAGNIYIINGVLRDVSGETVIFRVFHLGGIETVFSQSHSLSSCPYISDSPLTMLVLCRLCIILEGTLKYFGSAFSNNEEIVLRKNNRKRARNALLSCEYSFSFKTFANLKILRSIFV